MQATSQPDTATKRILRVHRRRLSGSLGELADALGLVALVAVHGANSGARVEAAVRSPNCQ